MNTVASQIALFTDESVVCSGLIRSGPSLYKWAIDAEPGLGPDDYASRVHYLEWIFRDVIHTKYQRGPNLENHLQKCDQK